MTTIWSVSAGNKGAVYVDINSTLFAYDADSGALRWSIGR
jgi:hypothetical protein